MERKIEEQRISEKHNWFYAKINKTEKVSQSKGKTHISKIRGANTTIMTDTSRFYLKIIYALGGWRGEEQERVERSE